MRREKPDPELAKWCVALASLTTPVDIVPPGWLTIHQVAQKTGQPKQTAQAKLKRLLALGQAERKSFRIRLAKNTRPVPHYRLK